MPFNNLGMNSAAEFGLATYTSNAGRLPYRLLKPPTIESGRIYPLVIFLHGIGERGTDNQAQLKWGPNRFAEAKERETHPCFVIAPQCPPDKLWVEVPRPDATKPHTMPKEPSVPMGLLMELLLTFMKANPVDASRVYAVGLSMGGYGTWDIIARRPDLFAAAVPICGGADIATAKAIAHIPVWVWHGDKDDLIPAVRSRSMVAAMRGAGANPKYNEISGGDHFAWIPAFRDPALLDWLFEQRLPKKNTPKMK
jgi:predicted peptidase